MEVTAGNVHDSVAWDAVYDKVTRKFREVKFVTMDACLHGGVLRHTTTDRNGKRTYRSTPAECRDCPYKAKCGANETGQKVYTTYIWQEHLDLVEEIRKTDRAKEIYALRKQTIEAWPPSQDGSGSNLLQ